MILAKCYKDSDPSIPILTHDLIVGKSYPVESINLSLPFTGITINGKVYNSIFFQFFEDGKEINIYQNLWFVKRL